jgi:outer membrane lipoprotein-sorting protein
MFSLFYLRRLIMSQNIPLTVIRTLLMLLICGSTGFGQTKGMSAPAIVEKMAAQYANASSYQDTGVVQDSLAEDTNRLEEIIKFKTFFARPHFLRFEWTDRDIATTEERLNVVWNDGKDTYHYYSWDDPAVERTKNIGLGIAGATGISRGSAHTVPALLMEEIGGFRLIEMSNLSMIGEERFEGEDCYLIRGYHPHNFPIDMWISKRDFLLRKIKKPHDDGSYQVEIRRGVRLNEKITPETFMFKPPPPKTKSRPQIVAWRLN